VGKAIFFDSLPEIQKSPNLERFGDAVFHPRPYCLQRPDYVLGRLNSATHQAGLLASGSANRRAFPFDPQWPLAAIVPGYSGGPVTDLHRLPFSTLAGNLMKSSLYHVPSFVKQ
jgi:hypothetical protein